MFTAFRGISEILAGDLPVGWDSVNYYAPWTITYAQHGVLNQNFLAAPPFVFIFTIPLYLLTSNIWLVMKVLAPVLYGVVGVSVFFFSRSYLSWSMKKSSFCAMLLMFQLAAMRIGWDLFKNELAIALLFFLLPVIDLASKKFSGKLAFLIVGLSLLMVLSHQYVAAIYFLILLAVMIDKTRTMAFKKRFAALNVPALALFVVIVGIYAGWAMPLVPAEAAAIYPLRAVYYYDFPSFSFFQNYLAGGSYSALFTDTLTLFFLLYAVVLPFAILGFWHDRFLTPILSFLLIGSFLPLISPSFAMSGSDRWMFMLIYVFAFYAVNGVSKLNQRSKTLLNYDNKLVRFRRVTRCIYARKLEITYLLFLALFSISYEFGMLHQLYEPIRYVPSRYSQTIISSTDMKEMTTNIEWLNSQYRDNFALDFFDHFESLNHNWGYNSSNNLALENSIVTLNVSANGGCSLSRDFGLDYFGSVEVKFRVNNISTGSKAHAILAVRRSNGHGGGIVFAGESLSFWDSESMLSHVFVPLDEDWHIVKVICNETGRTIFVDGLEKSYDEEKEPFGELILGSTSGSRTGSGSLSIDYVSVQGYLKPCLLTYFRELGIVWINLDERFEIITCAQDFQGALDYAANGSYTQILLMLSTNPFKGNFATVHEMPHYSIFDIDRDSISGDVAYIEAAVNKPQSGGSWVSVRDDFSWSGAVMKASASSLNDDILFGPYINREWTGDSMQGRLYTATLRLKVSSTMTGNAVSVDICHNEGAVLKSMTIRANDLASSDTWQDFQMTFAAPNSIIRGLEFRVKNLNHDVTDVFVDRISIRKVCKAPVVYAEAAVNKPQSGGSWVSVRDDFSWSGAVMKASASSLNDDILFGPYIDTHCDGENIMGNQYNAHFRLKVSSNQSTSDVLYIDASCDLGHILNSSLIKASDFSSSDAWQDFHLTFLVPGSLAYGLELRIMNTNNGAADVFVDYVNVTTG